MNESGTEFFEGVDSHIVVIVEAGVLGPRLLLRVDVM